MRCQLAAPSVDFHTPNDPYPAGEYSVGNVSGSRDGFGSMLKPHGLPCIVAWSRSCQLSPKSVVRSQVIARPSLLPAPT